MEEQFTLEKLKILKENLQKFNGKELVQLPILVMQMEEQFFVLPLENI
jgi:hypothetical protein